MLNILIINPTNKIVLKIYKPIFILGVPRSGTTLFYDILAQHKDVTWFSQYSIRENLTEDFLDFLNKRRRIFKMRNWKYVEDGFETRFRTTFESPFEPAYLWNYWFPNTWVSQNDVNGFAWKNLRQTIIDLMKRNGKKRFLSKDPSHSVRIEFLNKIFPGALFINITRDGRAVVDSMLNWLKTHNDPLGYFGIELKNKNTFDFDPLERHARQWLEVTEEIQRAKKSLDEDQFYDIKYEELIKDPEQSIKNILNFCQLEYEDLFSKKAIRVDGEKFEKISKNLSSRNDLWKQRFTDDEQTRLNNLIKRLLVKLEYA